MYKTIQTVFVGDGNYNNLMNSIKGGQRPFKYMDYLYVAFADLKPNSNPPQIYFKSEYEQNVREIIAEAKKQNPSLIVFAQVNWASTLAPLDTEAKIEAFAKSIPPFLKQYGLVGIDFDWEQVPFDINLASYLFTQVKTQIGSEAYLSISADKTTSLKPSVVNQYVDIVNVQSYQRLWLVDEFIDFGIDKNKIYIGIASENDDPNAFYPSGGGVSDYINKCVDTGTAGLYLWRIDNDDTDHAINVPRYTITKQIWQFTKGTMATEIGGGVFEDTNMRRDAKGNPQAVPPITEMIVRYGNVVNAIQTINGDLKLPQHGGYSGIAAPTIKLDEGDNIIEVSGYTGTWFGWNCVLQLMLTTKNGKTYGPYGSMADASQKIPFSFKALTGQSIVAFKGTLISIPLKDAPETTVIESLSVSFA
ncbi:glycosyl hydrolase family 18 protein [Nostoc sp. PCC 7107]|uniref:jacalin-like lectin n=1 Tax=Nostoc sp. PCC 7107 TaxID=317936 RepID=UPI00029ED634|nr:glycosyl hydrolase family 18 protein [Nostoc sp. PCC 7107]AFY43925.1 glycoside hydrolase family 18 [Nostoc sp. PCC 7107]